MEVCQTLCDCDSPLPASHLRHAAVPQDRESVPRTTSTRPQADRDGDLCEGERPDAEAGGVFPLICPPRQVTFLKCPELGHPEVYVAMTSRQAIAFIRMHGVVLESAQGPVPSLAEAIAGEPVRGSWWSHPKRNEIFAVTRVVRDSGDVLVCRLIKGKVTFVHRRLWPALVRVASRFPSDHLSQVREVHTSSGRHVIKEIPFPHWVPSSIRAAARNLAEEAALAEFAAWIK